MAVRLPRSFPHCHFSAFGGPKTELKRSTRAFAGCWLEEESKTHDGGIVVVQPLAQQPGNYATLLLNPTSYKLKHFFLSFRLLIPKIHLIMYLRRLQKQNKAANNFRH